ncbi:hypothetical protein ACET9K_15605 [Aeromonas enteropelogenes]|nr:MULTISPECIES: hypothetical protein [Aeromonas]MCZ0753152.1 hypothetical protein [Aeromonas enteropelogenes]BEE23888.1 hypothetical protein VAWG007_39830 [Aeromonas enteropelogenes]
MTLAYVPAGPATLPFYPVKVCLRLSLCGARPVGRSSQTLAVWP